MLKTNKSKQIKPPKAFLLPTISKPLTPKYRQINQKYAETTHQDHHQITQKYRESNQQNQANITTINKIKYKKPTNIDKLHSYHSKITKISTNANITQSDQVFVLQSQLSSPKNVYSAEQQCNSNRMMTAINMAILNQKNQNAVNTHSPKNQFVHQKLNYKAQKQIKVGNNQLQDGGQLRHAKSCDKNKIDNKCTDKTTAIIDLKNTKNKRLLDTSQFNDNKFGSDNSIRNKQKHNDKDNEKHNDKHKHKTGIVLQFPIGKKKCVTYFQRNQQNQYQQYAQNNAQNQNSYKYTDRSLCHTQREYFKNISNISNMNTQNHKQTLTQASKQQNIYTQAVRTISRQTKYESQNFVVKPLESKNSSGSYKQQNNQVHNTKQKHKNTDSDNYGGGECSNSHSHSQIFVSRKNNMMERRDVRTRMLKYMRDMDQRANDYNMITNTNNNPNINRLPINNQKQSHLNNISQTTKYNQITHIRTKQQHLHDKLSISGWDTNDNVDNWYTYRQQASQVLLQSIINSQQMFY